MSKVNAIHDKRHTRKFYEPLSAPMTIKCQIICGTMTKIIEWFPTCRYFYRMEQLLEDLRKSGLTLDQIKEVFTIISKWTNTNYPVMGTLVENILRRNRLI
jgi:hypothetical protein